MQKTMVEQQYLNMQQLAKLLGCDRVTAYRIAEKIGYVNIGFGERKMRRVDSRTVERFLTQRRNK